MFRYLIRRILWAMLLFWVITVVTYVIFFIIPVNPAKQACGQRATETCINLARKNLGLDKPVYVQYAHFLGKMVLHGDLGRSYVTRQEVRKTVLTAAPVTASLVLGGVVLWLLVSVPLGVLSALKPRSLLDRGGMVFVLIGISAHPVWLGLIFLYVFAFKLGIAPLGQYCDFIHPATNCGGPAQWAWHLMLPWATFAILYAALYVRMIRANVMETKNEDYVRTARAKGAPELTVIRSHILRNALLPVVTILGLDIGAALGGAIFTETIYNLPGLGNTALLSINQFDLPVTQGIVVFATISILTFNLVVDLLYAIIDPRIRLT